MVVDYKVCYDLVYLSLVHLGLAKVWRVIRHYLDLLVGLAEQLQVPLYNPVDVTRLHIVLASPGKAK